MERIVEAQPVPVKIDLQRTAVLVVDMQNAFVSKGGMLDLLGIDVSHVASILGPINTLTSAARGQRCKVIHIATASSPDGRDSGGPDHAHWYRDTTLNMTRQFPERKDKCLFRGTWGQALVEGLVVAEGDIVFEKARTSAFFQTNLDTVLKTYGTTYLVVTGVATNICVEATIRDAYNLGYFPILVSDASAPAGPPITQEATIFNVMAVYGWVTTTDCVLKALD